MRHALSIDLEEFFQIHALSDVIDPGSWETHPSSVGSNTAKILDLLESNNIIATFFCLGWIARRHPDLIKRIHNMGHEVACHGHSHQVIYCQNRQSFYQDVSKAKMILEDITGSSVIGYRAPTYSITKKTIWALEILEELGFRYDSSIFPIYHDNYGIPDAPRLPHIIEGTSIAEFPISTLSIGRYNLPISGGGYFRLFPYPVTKMALKLLEKRHEPFVFYIHPWEFNPDTPRVAGLSSISRFRTYVGINQVSARFKALIEDFSFTTLPNVLDDLGLLPQQP
ncbi:MAG TPA: DUF3473 domain-containing protein [Deltaproteobacteria bacterium]|nr:DUF3473 domain-containing protein [Deltaproteobacteria bacterium]